MSSNRPSNRTGPAASHTTSRKTRHRFNRAGDIADDIAGALFSRDPAHRENPEAKRRLSRMPSRIKDRFEPTQSKPQQERHNPTPDQSDPEALTRIWDACCQRCLNTSSTSDTNSSSDNNNHQHNHQHDERFEATGARLVWIDADEAVVYAQSPIWATRVRMLAPSLVACMRQSGMAEISRLRVRVQPTETVCVPRSRPINPISAESAEILNAAADRTPDEDLAERLKRLARHARKAD